MALRGVSPELADRLVETALGDLSAVKRLPNGQWQLADGSGTPAREVRFVCLAVRKAADGSGVRLGWSVLQEGKWTRGAAVTLSVGEAGKEVPPLLVGAEPVVFWRRQAGVGAALDWLRRLGTTGQRVWEVRRAVENLFPGQTIREQHRAATLLGETWLEEASVALEAEGLAALWQRILENAEELGFADTDALWAELGQEPVPLDFGRFAFGPEKIAALPARPGVYLMRDASGQVAYVGKARNLAARLPVYFRSPERVSERDRRIVREIVDFEIAELGSELEALLVEQRLIGLYRPRLNTQVEVHPREHWERVRGNYALVLPSSRSGCAEVFLINRGGRLTQIRTRPGLPNRTELEAAVSALFFEKPEEVGISVEGEITFSWLAKVQPWERAVFVDRCANPRECVQQIGALVNESLHVRTETGLD